MRGLAQLQRFNQENVSEKFRKTPLAFSPCELHNPNEMRHQEDEKAPLGMKGGEKDWARYAHYSNSKTSASEETAAACRCGKNASHHPLIPILESGDPVRCSSRCLPSAIATGNNGS